MKHDYNHIDLNANPGAPDEFFRRLEIPYNKSREEAWETLNKKLDEKPGGKILALRSRRLIFASAAMIIILAGVFSLLRFYTTTVYCPAGQHLAYQLPDGSSIELNADSRLAYKPLWWRVSREIFFEGEGYFEVEKGKKFAVISGQGRTEVLGTSFNIYSRENEYKVTCLTGKVKVISFASAEVELEPEQSARVNAKGEILLTRESKASESHSWVNNMFSFTSRPLALVFSEIGRQYGISITLKSTENYLYTGFFTKNRSVEETLTLVCTPFGLNFTRISEKEYVISQN
ncbi:MAG: iron dicitrate transport regulator FecR [Bacteroidales bacterium]|nr:iron dicitrate transport regulator FecR [Bacteroidales bacterium]